MALVNFLILFAMVLAVFVPLILLQRYWNRKYGIHNTSDFMTQMMRNWGDAVFKRRFERQPGEAEKSRPDYSVYDAGGDERAAAATQRLEEPFGGGEIAYYDDDDADLCPQQEKAFSTES